jgi:hypothetical protein
MKSKPDEIPVVCVYFLDVSGWTSDDGHRPDHCCSVFFWVIGRSL